MIVISITNTGKDWLKNNVISPDTPIKYKALAAMLDRVDIDTASLDWSNSKSELLNDGLIEEKDLPICTKVGW